MKSLKIEFIKYLSDNYLNRINEDVNKKLVSLGETGLLLRTTIDDISVLDSDDAEFVFKLKLQSEVLGLTGNSKFYLLHTEYSCHLNDGIKDLILVTIDEGKDAGRFTYRDSLTESFIPLNKTENYEKLAIRFLSHYFGKGYKEYPLNVIELVKKVGVKVFSSTNFKDSLGKTIFHDCNLQLSNTTDKTHLPKGSIVINVKNLLLTGNNKLARTTIVHECIHWHYHRKAFEIIMLLNNEYKYFDCLDYTNVDKDDPILSSFAWMESQAYALTKACLMLEENVTAVIGNSFENVADIENGMEQIDYYYSIVSKASDTFGTTLNDTVKRLSLLGYSEVNNLRNEYYDSVYDSVIQHETLDDGQTRRISKRIFSFMLEHSNNLQIAIHSGLYVYADGFVVINSPKYLITIGEHHMLNTYARNHIEECSLIFNVRKDYKPKFNPADALQLITANSGAGGTTILIGDTEAYVIAPFMLDSILKQPEPERSYILKNSYIHDDDTSFSVYFKSLILKYRFVSVQDIIEATHCSRSVIENYRDYDDVGYSVEKVLSICAGMKITPPEAKFLIKKSGVIDLSSNNNRARVYRDLVENHWPYNIEEWNEILKSKHMPTLYS